MDSLKNPKFVAGAALFVAWGVAVCLGKAPVGEFVSFCDKALTCIAIYHTTLKDPKS